MLRTLIIYESRYGATGEAALWLSMIMGPSHMCNPDTLPDDYQQYDFIIIGFPVYGEQIPCKINNFITAEQKWLQTKPTALFSISMNTLSGSKLLEQIQSQYLPSAVVKAFPGRLCMDKLSASDQANLHLFLQKTGMKLSSLDFLHPSDVAVWGLELKALRDQYLIQAPTELVKSLVDDILARHNTCVLSTSSPLGNRGTPIEYKLWNEQLTILSEGGEKFAHLLQNPEVSISIADSYNGMASLAGLQLSGIAALIEPGSEQYTAYMKDRGINWHKLPVALNLITVNLKKAELIHYLLKEKGYSIRQIYIYQ